VKIVIFKFLFVFLGIHLARFIGQNPMSGLLIGLVIGHAMDHAASRKILEWRIARFQKKEGEKFLREHLIGNIYFLFGKLCAVDGPINDAEKTSALSIASTVFNLKPRDAAYALKKMEEAEVTDKALQSSAVSFYEINSNAPDTLELCVRLCFELASSDGMLSEREIEVNQQIASVFGISPKTYANISRSYLLNATTESDLKQYYALLGCTADDSDVKIKKNYRKLVSEYHPDKIQSKDLPADFIAFANQKIQNIQEAYEAVKSARGIS
jgi:DnaJ like chaperone protein